MNVKNFPYKAWRLTPGMKPVQVDICRSNGKWDRRSKPVVDSKDKSYALGELFETKQEAIENGHRLLKIQHDRAAKSLASVLKKMDNLAAAEQAE